MLFFRVKVLVWHGNTFIYSISNHDNVIYIYDIIIDMYNTGLSPIVVGCIPSFAPGSMWVLWGITQDS